MLYNKGYKADTKWFMDKFVYGFALLICLYYVPANWLPTAIMKEEKLLSSELTKDYMEQFKKLKIESLTVSSFNYKTWDQNKLKIVNECSTRYTVKMGYNKERASLKDWFPKCMSITRNGAYDFKVVNTGDKLVAYTLFAPEEYFIPGDRFQKELKYTFYRIMEFPVRKAEAKYTSYKNSQMYEN